jgi:glycosyltransferase involved in cell wall biosynthesis
MNQITALIGTRGRNSLPSHIALIGNSPPRRCGIATYTADCHRALAARHPQLRIDYYAMDDGVGDIAYPENIRTIAADDRVAYAAAAQAIDASGAEAIWLQHEFGIFGGAAGAHILHLLERSALPLIATLHTVLDQPTPDQDLVFRAIIDRAEHLIVMADFGRAILEQRYGVAPERISVIPHGVPHRPLVPSADIKPRFGLEGRNVVLTFGLLAPDKGIDMMIRAMPEILARHPDTLYLVLGATHPNLVRREGEKLRDSLNALAASLGVADNVRFLDEYLELPQLLDYLQAADIYVTPYANPAQVTSGTLSYAVGMGKPVVSTPYVHAREILSDDHGILVPFRDSQALAAAINRLLDDDALRAGFAARAYARGRGMLWETCADRVVALLGAARRPPPLRMAAARNPGICPPDLRAVERMSDDTGIYQHGRFSIPDRNHGYCLDDNARALMLLARMDGVDPRIRDRWTSVYGGFVEHAWNEDVSGFRNFMRFDRSWCEDIGSEDSRGRAVWALSVTVRDHPHPQYRDWARHLLERCLPPTERLGSPRTRAFVMLGLAALSETPNPPADGAAQLAALGEELLALLSAARRPRWVWFEDVLAYDNARLPEALLRAGHALGRRDFIKAGVTSLNWLIDRQTADEGHFRAVGSESFGRRHADPLPFDQQPLEAQATIDACAAAFAATGDAGWLVHARTAYDWFLGRNDLGIPVAVPEDGGCFDGLTPRGVNRNQGAESILAFQLSNCTMSRLSRAGQSDFDGNPLAREIVAAQV